ncbi:MAG: UvrD-helicase domain-containing protein [Planctomycetota bacterium]
MNPASSITDGLNSAQHTAVTTTEGPLLVIAGAGSGKTRVITRRIARLVELGIPPETILAVTFTNKAAKEMRERVQDLIGGGGAEVSTFHAFGSKFLRGEASRLDRPETFSLYDRSDSESAIKACVKALVLDKTAYGARAVLDYISSWKSRLIAPDAAEEEALSQWEEDAVKIYRRYEDLLRESGAFDFDDLISKSVYLLETHPDLCARVQDYFQYLLVDEYQDVNFAQYRLTKLLGDGHRNICVTGDPDQCIYTWRGADINYILDFEKHYPDAKVVRLEQNYRSVNNILRAASAVIRFNSKHGEKELWSEKPDGPPIVVRRLSDDSEEARAIVERIQTLQAQGENRRDIAVFYRLNSLSLPVERALMMANIPYQVVHGLEFFKRKEVKDALAWLRFLANEHDRVSLMRIINFPPRGLGQKTLDRTEEAARSAGLSLGAFLRSPNLGAGLSKRASAALRQFAALSEELRADLGGAIAGLLRSVLDRTGYETHLKEKADGLDPFGNLEQLIGFARDYEMNPSSRGLSGFLEEISLYTDTDGYQVEEDKVVLMTVHAAKGLEYRHVIMMGLDAELFPHQRPDGRTDQEEERRLFYVGLTRGMESVTLLTTQARTRFGRQAFSLPSVFLTEIPEELTEVIDDVGGEMAPDLDRQIEYEMEDDLQIRKGSRIQHRSFGPGTIQGIAGRGGDARVTIEFDSGERKKFILRYAGLEPLY